MDGVAFNSINEVEASRLESSFEECEVLEVVKCMYSDKALGLDSFSMAFFQAGWGVSRHIIVGAFHNFHTRSKLK